MGTYDDQIAQANQQALMAQKLREGIQQPEGQMVSGWYIPPSIAQYLGGAVKNASLSNAEQTARAQAQGLTATKQAKMAEALKSYNSGGGNQSIMDLSQVDMPTAQLGMQLSEKDAARTAQAQNLQAAREQVAQQAEANRLNQLNIAKDRNETLKAIQENKPEKLVSVVAQDGSVRLVPQSQAAGMAPAPAGGKNAPLTPQQKDQAALSAQQAIDQAAKIFNHPGKKWGTGSTSFLGGVPGTDTLGFQANLETFKAQTFLPMVQALKGMGALSDAEGKKLSDSIGALNPKMKQSEFDDNLKEATRFLYEKAKASGLDVKLPEFAAVAPASGGAKFLGFE